MGAIICYDCGNEASLENVHSWVKDFREKAMQGAPVLLVSTKADYSEQVPVEDSNVATNPNDVSV